jgi:hypothetical protein
VLAKAVCEMEAFQVGQLELCCELPDELGRQSEDGWGGGCRPMIVE